MIFKVSYTIDNVDCRWEFFKDRENAKKDFLKRCCDLGVNKNTWKVSKLKNSLEYWNTVHLKVGDINFWMCVGVKVTRISTRD